jgi:hypothetical protein
MEEHALNNCLNTSIYSVEWHLHEATFARSKFFCFNIFILSLCDTFIVKIGELCRKIKFFYINISSLSIFFLLSTLARSKLGEGERQQARWGKGTKLGEPCPKVRLSQDRLPIEPSFFLSQAYFAQMSFAQMSLRSNVIQPFTLT